MLAGMQTRIVLVDDDDLYREVMTADLEDRGYAVQGFADGAALLAAVQAGIAAELALIDWSLPQIVRSGHCRDLSGVELGNGAQPVRMRRP